MSWIEDARKLLQGFVAPELRGINQRLDDISADWKKQFAEVERLAQERQSASDKAAQERQQLLEGSTQERQQASEKAAQERQQVLQGLMMERCTATEKLASDMRRSHARPNGSTTS